MTLTNLPYEEKGYTKYGAQMGRHGGHPGNEPEGKLYLRRVPINSGGYDPGGAYWGLGPPLWWYGDGADVSDYFRARSREDAKRKVLEMWPDAKFYR